MPHRPRPFFLIRPLCIGLLALSCTLTLPALGQAPAAPPVDDVEQRTAPVDDAPVDDAPADDAAADDAPGDDAEQPVDPSDRASQDGAPLAFTCLTDATPTIDVCLSESAAHAAAGKPVEAAALAERACELGEVEGCTLGGRLLLPTPATRLGAKRLLTQACEKKSTDGCLALGDAERAGLFGAPNDDAAVLAYQRGCTAERLNAAQSNSHGPNCAALVDTLGEDPFLPTPPGAPQKKPPTAVPAAPPRHETDPPRKMPAGDNGRVPSTSPAPGPVAEDFTQDPLLSTRARFPLGGFLLEGGGRLYLGASSNPWRLPSPANAPAPFLHGGAGVVTFAPSGRILFDLFDAAGASLEATGDWSGFFGGDLQAPGNIIANPASGGFLLDVMVGLGRTVLGRPVQENGSDRNQLSVRNRTRARLSPGQFLPVFDVGTARAERDGIAPHILVPLANATPGDFIGTSENLFNLDARLDFLVNLEFGYAWTRQRVEVVNPSASSADIGNILSLPLFFLPLGALTTHDFDEHAGRARAGLSLPKFEFFGPAHVFGEFSLARRTFSDQLLYPSTARAGLDATASIFELRLDAGVANAGLNEIFGSESHFVGGASIAVPLVARWWLAAAAERRLLTLSLADWALTTNAEISFENRGHATAIALFGRAGALEFGAATGLTPSTAFFSQTGARAELRIGPFRPSIEGNIQAYLPREGTNPTSVVVGEARVGIGF